VAHDFFNDYPTSTSFEKLIEAATKARVEESVRAAALRFLETGTAPFQAIAARPAQRAPKATRTTSKGRVPASREVAPQSEATATTDRVKIDKAWLLPLPDYLVPLLRRRGPDDPPRPHLDVLLSMAIEAKRPDEVLRWFDRIRSQARQAGYHRSWDTHADEVAAAVASTHPARAQEIYLGELKARLPLADFAAYQTVVSYLKKLRPIYGALGRPSEWQALVTSIRETYRNRPRFMELLDGLDGRTIVQSAQARRKGARVH
jgi:uncharacterized Zn finger protein